MLRRKKNLLSKTEQTASVNGDPVQMDARLPQRLLCRLSSTAVAPGTLDVVVQHNPSFTSATGWKTIATFAQQTNETGDSGIEDVHVSLVTTHLFPNLRAVATIAGGGSYTFTVDAWMD